MPYAPMPDRQRSIPSDAKKIMHPNLAMRVRRWFATHSPGRSNLNPTEIESLTRLRERREEVQGPPDSQRIAYIEFIREKGETFHEGRDENGNLIQ